jgi:hypothetical protein
MCYCDKPEAEILADLKRDLTPDDALLRMCCWRKVCRVRGQRFMEVDDGVWNKVCDRRVQLIAKQDPMGRA